MHDLQQAAVTAFGDRDGAAVAVDVRTGEVLAMVSLPQFNPNLFVNGIDVETYRKLRNTMRYILANLSGFAESERVAPKDMPELERWVLHRLSELDQTVRDPAVRAALTEGRLALKQCRILQREAMIDAPTLAEAEAATIGITFAELGLSAPMLASLVASGYLRPTPIQASASCADRTHEALKRCATALPCFTM